MGGRGAAAHRDPGRHPGRERRALRPGAGRNQPARAIRELGLASWVAGLPDGMDTRLGEGGHVLSAGQEQLVAFARILVRDPHVVILDEATARLDPVTEAQVQRATERLLRDRIGSSSPTGCPPYATVTRSSSSPTAGWSRPGRWRSRSASRGCWPAASSTPRPAATTTATGATATATATGVAAPTVALAVQTMVTARPKTDPPSLPTPAPARTLREIFRLATNDARLRARGGRGVRPHRPARPGRGGAALAVGRPRGRHGCHRTSGVGIVAGLLCTAPLPYFTGRWFPEWWVRQMLRISLRLVHGQTGPRRVSAHTPAEVVAQGGDTERVVILADNVLDQFMCCFIMISMTLVSGTFVPAAFFAGTMVLSGTAAALFGPVLERCARATVAARAAFATALVSSLSSARTVKLAGATGPVLAHLSQLDRKRSDRQRREIAIQVMARSTPAIASGLLPIGAWALYLSGGLSSGATLVAVSTLGSARWFAWTTASLVSQLPSARVWTRRTVAMSGIGAYTASVPGVDLSAGTAPPPAAAPRHPLRSLELAGFTAVHEDGTVGVKNIDLTVARGQLVLVIGPVGSGKSSLLRALAGIVHHTGDMRWNGTPVAEPELFLRPNQVGYVAQLPRVLSGTIADNIRLGHEVDPTAAVSTAQLDHDLAAAGGGLGLLIGHKGTRLSGGQLQRLALARALAPRTELLLADDVSSALDVTTELDLWRALRDHGLTVIGSTSKHAALTQADTVVVLLDGVVAAHGPWSDLARRWGHLAG